jgi:hypothetical protein
MSSRAPYRSWTYKPVPLDPVNPSYVDVEALKTILSNLEVGKKYVVYFPLKTDLGFHTISQSQIIARDTDPQFLVDVITIGIEKIVSIYQVGFIEALFIKYRELAPIKDVDNGIEFKAIVKIVPAPFRVCRVFCCFRQFVLYCVFCNFLYIVF